MSKKVSILVILLFIGAICITTSVYAVNEVISNQIQPRSSYTSEENSTRNRCNGN